LTAPLTIPIAIVATALRGHDSLRSTEGEMATWYGILFRDWRFRRSRLRPACLEEPCGAHPETIRGLVRADAPGHVRHLPLSKYKKPASVALCRQKKLATLKSLETAIHLSDHKHLGEVTGNCPCTTAPNNWARLSGDLELLGFARGRICASPRVKWESV